VTLKTEQVGEYTVSEAGMREAVRRVLMVKRIQVMFDAGEMDEEEKTALSIYPHIAGCITPQITVNQFMQLKETEIDKLSEAAMRLNPHWFAVPDEEKKTSELLPTPMTDLTN
jgi:hypothetical protein